MWGLPQEIREKACTCSRCKGPVAERVEATGDQGREGDPRGQSRLTPPSPPGSGHLSASWEPLSGPSAPSPVAAQFTSEGVTLSGVDLELVGSGYRMSLVKRRFATGEGQKRGADGIWGDSGVGGESLRRPGAMRPSG
jgi:hypothetical protein